MTPQRANLALLSSSTSRDLLYSCGRCLFTWVYESSIIFQNSVDCGFSCLVRLICSDLWILVLDVCGFVKGLTCTYIVKASRFVYLKIHDRVILSLSC